MTATLYIGNLSHGVTEVELRHLFAGFGAVHAAWVYDRLATSSPTVTGLVQMEREADGEAAIAALDGRAYRGIALVVRRARPGQDEGVDVPRMFESMNIPEADEGHSAREPHGPRHGDLDGGNVPPQAGH